MRAVELNAMKSVTDRRGRRLRDLRISVTDRCNFRCVYCMPKEHFGQDHAFLERRQLLSFEEITRVARAFVRHGVRKLRLTGGEPLVRRDIEKLVAALSAIPGVEDISLTTNGSLLTAAKARVLKDAGLRRVTVSLDAVDPTSFAAINDVRFPVGRVLQAIDDATHAGLAPVKVNMVVARGVNDDQVLAMARHFRGTGAILRFIEFMDVGTTNGWRLDKVIPAQEIVDLVHAEHPLGPVSSNYRGEVAKRWRYLDGEGEIGVISSVTQPFCGTCTRARLSAEGMFYSCLFAARGHDFRELIRDRGASDEQVSEFIGEVWRARSDRYSEIRSEATVELPRIEMSYIGG